MMSDKMMTLPTIILQVFSSSLPVTFHLKPQPLYFKDYFVSTVKCSKAYGHLTANSGSNAGLLSDIGTEPG